MRYRFDRHRRRSRLSRAFLKCTISIYTGLGPESVAFETGGFGKPEIRNQGDYGDLRFNATQSGETSLIGFSRRTRLGIDVETVDTRVDVRSIVEHYFALGESQRFREHAAEGRYDLFFRMWTLKEAYVKAIGKGLYHPLSSFEVPISSERSTSVEGHGEAEGWYFREIDVGQGIKAALVTDSPIANIRFWDWTPDAIAWMGKRLSHGEESGACD